MRAVAHRNYVHSLEIARELVAANQDPDANLRRAIIIALRRCGPITTANLVELLIVALDGDEDLDLISRSLEELHTK